MVNQALNQLQLELAVKSRKPEDVGRVLTLDGGGTLMLETVVVWIRL